MSSHPPHIPDAVPESRERTRRVDQHSTVAVIAIHGVGRHLPGASAEALATLLASVGRKDGEAGPHFARRPLRGL